MPFSFFRGEKPRRPNARDVEARDDETVLEIDEETLAAEAEAAGEEHTDDDPAEVDASWRDRAAAVIPGGASTGSKRPTALYGDADAHAPSHFVRAAGCRVSTPGGLELIDCTMALGAVALGYAHPDVGRAVIDALRQGPVAGLSDVREVELAERLCDVIPCAESVRFLKSGAEAVSAAVRIARTATAKEHVIASGYFGWHDWATDAAGVPAATKTTVHHAPFDDVGALERAVTLAGRDLAAIVLEPVVERLPSAEWIAAARDACDRTGAVLIFDEMKTGFRLRTGGFQELSGVTPDLATFGKALANGFPLAIVCGKRDIMDAANRTWISSTLASEGTALAAALAVLDWHEQAEVCEVLEQAGHAMRTSVAAAIESSGIGGVSTDGLDAMWLMRWDDPARETRFLERAIANGVLFKRGAYNYASLAHDDDALAEIEAAASTSFVEMLESDDA